MKKQSILFLALMVPLLGTLIFSQAYAQRAQRTGEITKIDAENKSFMVRTARGQTNILTTENTVFKKGDEEIGFEDLTVGASLLVIGVRKGADVEAQQVTVQAEKAEPSGDMM